MTVRLVLEAASQPLERIRADVSVVGFAPEDRPLLAAAGRADWRLCGRLSELIAAGRLTGARGEAALIAGGAGLRSPLLLALGIGPRVHLGAASWRALGRDSISRVLKLGARTAALGMLPDGADSVGFRALIQGAVQAIGAEPLRLVLPEPPAAQLVQAVRPESLPGGVEVQFQPATPALRWAAAGSTESRYLPPNPLRPVK